jgi:uncharacterized protein (TIGR02118 family)
MIKVVFCLARRPELSRDAFQRYWRETHAPLVAAAKNALAIRRYIQCHTVPTAIDDALRAARGMADDYDGVAELWWDDEASLVAATASAEGARHAAILVEDEAKFVDFSRSRIFFVREHAVIA